MMSVQAHSPATIKVWDPLVRLFHWSLVVTFFIAFITEDDWINLHVATGYAVAMLVGFRLVWGLIGTRYARFSQFVKSPAQVLSYIKKMLTFNVPHYVGHNPAAAAMIISLLISIIMLSITGMVIIAAEGQGPLAGTFMAGFNAEWMEEIHEFFANFTMLLVVAHVAGVFFSSMLEGDNLLRAMITGRKKYRSDVLDKNS
ncbi:MAG: cytochrome b/b6 domain-containing protein [Gammaproteobacteria bacterium]|nr:cytochrome b/b6 domain-containing protein [Gammaproteobacteria bacterium]